MKCMYSMLISDNTVILMTEINNLCRMADLYYLSDYYEYLMRLDKGGGGVLSLNLLYV